ncbi:hypothetical protein Naga_101603g1, partial [Nannochloropsis gaditana]
MHFTSFYTMQGNGATPRSSIGLSGKDSITTAMRTCDMSSSSRPPVLGPSADPRSSIGTMQTEMQHEDSLPQENFTPVQAPADPFPLSPSPSSSFLSSTAALAAAPSRPTTPVQIFQKTVHTDIFPNRRVKEGERKPGSRYLRRLPPSFQSEGLSNLLTPGMDAWVVQTLRQADALSFDTKCVYFFLILKAFQVLEKEVCQEGGRRASVPRHGGRVPPPSLPPSLPPPPLPSSLPPSLPFSLSDISQAPHHVSLPLDSVPALRAFFLAPNTQSQLLPYLRRKKIVMASGQVNNQVP